MSHLTHMNIRLVMLSVTLFAFSAPVLGRQGGVPVKDTAIFPVVTTADSGNVIHLIHADLLIGIQPKDKDSAQWQKLIGNVVMRQGQTIFSCDSALQNLTLNTMDAYGHIHINQADSIHTYSDYLHYEINTRLATLKRNVRLTDGQMVLTTNLLNYDMTTHIGDYLQGGKLVNQNTVLTSERGYYYADTKDTYFKSNVHLVDPEYTLATDTLLYNSQTRIATFVAPTSINTGQSIIHTSCGYYSTDQNYAHLCNRSTIIDSTQTLTADSMNYDKNTGIGIGIGNVIWSDTLRKITLLANYATSDQVRQTVIATQKPLMIIERDKDTLYIASDTLFSGVLPRVDIDTTANGRLGTTLPDSVAGVPMDSAVVKTAAGDSTRDQNGIPKEIPDSLSPSISDSLMTMTEKSPVTGDSAQTLIVTDSADLADVLQMPEAETDTALVYHPADSFAAPQPSPAIMQQQAQTEKDTTQKRYIKAFHHVRLFSDSLQGVADSLYYSDMDSSFHFYYDPVLWTGDTQLIGDTIVMRTRNQAPYRMLLQQHALIINKTGPELYNQIKGNTVTGYFNESQLDWMHVDGNAESIYYAQDDAGKYVGANRTTSSAINLYFKDSQLNKAVFLKQVDGTFLQPTKVPPEDKELRGFRWESDRRPKSKTELMQ